MRVRYLPDRFTMSGNSHNPNLAVQALGQSFWYDNIQRAILNNGELQSLINDFGVLGITSNPAIFDKAITGSATTMRRSRHWRDRRGHRCDL